ncbi:MAG: V-type ATP synthase subunit F [Candidatus Schekmanbacteria bacterium]|nr:V-type ATP synthase subunit F [Candidatus Schekmanbacteria bacterium]
MPKMAILGERDAILGFKAVGVNVFPIKNTDEAEAVLRKLAMEDYAAIFVSERYAQDLELQIKEIERSGGMFPSIVIIPGPGVNQGLGMNKIKNMVEKALGMAILSTDEKQ